MSEEKKQRPFGLGSLAQELDEDLALRPEEEDTTAEAPEESDDGDDLPEEGTEERYFHDLRELGISRDEALHVLDTVLEQGRYEEPWALSPRVKGTFVTRTYADTLRLNAALETRNPQWAMSIQEIIARYNLAASLGSYGTNKFAHETDDDFSKVMDFVLELPAPVIQKLSMKLVRFDRKVHAVFADGAPDVF